MPLLSPCRLSVTILNKAVAWTRALAGTSWKCWPILFENVNYSSLLRYACSDRGCVTPATVYNAQCIITITTCNHLTFDNFPQILQQTNKPNKSLRLRNTYRLFSPLAFISATALRYQQNRDTIFIDTWRHGQPIEMFTDDVIAHRAVVEFYKWSLPHCYCEIRNLIVLCHLKSFLMGCTVSYLSRCRSTHTRAFLLAKNFF